ncbi:MAG: RidA family protein [Pseudomonadota bacterium]
MGKKVVGKPIVINGAPVPISQAVRAGDFLFIAGQLGVDDDFKVVGEDIETQTRRALANLEAQLKAGGGELADVVKVNAWLVDARDFAAYNTVYGSIFSDAPPVRTTVVSDLLIPGARIELDAIAFIG